MHPRPRALLAAPLIAWERVVMKAVPKDQAKPGDAYGLGEVSITQDGRFMYFTYILRESADGGFDGGPHDNLSIGVVRKP